MGPSVELDVDPFPTLYTLHFKSQYKMLKSWIMPL